MFAKWGFRHFAVRHPQTAWALLEMMAQRVRDAENRSGEEIAHAMR